MTYEQIESHLQEGIDNEYNLYKYQKYKSKYLDKQNHILTGGGESVRNPMLVLTSMGGDPVYINVNPKMTLRECLDKYYRLRIDAYKEKIDAIPQLETVFRGIIAKLNVAVSKYHITSDKENSEPSNNRRYILMAILNRIRIYHRHLKSTMFQELRKIVICYMRYISKDKNIFGDPELELHDAMADVLLTDIDSGSAKLLLNTTVVPSFIPIRDMMHLRNSSNEIHLTIVQNSSDVEPPGTFRTVLDAERFMDTVIRD